MGEMTTKTKLVNVCVQMIHTDEASVCLCVCVCVCVCAGDGWIRGVCCADRFQFTLPYGLVSSLERRGPLVGVPEVMGGQRVPWSTGSLFLLVHSREIFTVL